MAHINLLPWREAAQKAKEREYFTILAAVALCAFSLMFIISQYYQSRIDGQNNRNQFLTKEIQVLDARIAKIKDLKAKKAALESRISVVEQLQRSRNVGTKVLDEMAKIVPHGVYLTHIDKQDDIILLKGKTESNNHLANLIRAIDESELFSEPVLESILSTDAQRKLLSDFKMQLKIKGLIDPDIEREKS